MVGTVFKVRCDVYLSEQDKGRLATAYAEIAKILILSEYVTVTHKDVSSFPLGIDWKSVSKRAEELYNNMDYEGQKAELRGIMESVKVLLEES